MQRLKSLLAACAVACAIAVPAAADEVRGHREADEHDERAEGPEARRRAEYRISWRDLRFRYDPVVNVKLLGINDFHGQLSPRLIGARPAGGAAVLASYLEAAQAEARDGALIIHAGDHVGASPPNSALLQDEPSISVLNLLANRACFNDRSFEWLPHLARALLQQDCNVIGTFGNHEFDEGIDEALRLVKGGTHEDGPFLENPWRGARFPYVLSNVVWERSGKTVLPPYSVARLGGVSVGVVGAVTRETPTIVTPTGVASIKFLDEAAAINAAVRELKKLRVRTIVVTIHEGIRQTSYEGPTDPGVGNLSGPVVDIVRALDDEVDVVISGHAHAFTNALIPNANGKVMLVTQAFSAGTAYADIDLVLSRKSGDVYEKSAAIITTWADTGVGLAPDASTAAIVAAADAAVAPRVSAIVGFAAQAITRAENAAGESALGNLIADAQRASSGAQFAFMNPGGIRADLNAGEITWGELFTIQPFGNDLVSMDLTGAQIDTLLEQQWLGQPFPRILKTSGLRYTWDAARPAGDRVSAIVDAGGAALNPTATYRVTVNSFMAAGGDNLTVLVQGTNRVVGAVDLDALIGYVEAAPVPLTATIEGRIARIN